MLRLIASLLVLVFLSLPLRAAPALWQLADDDTTIHLFGTLHIIDPGVTWANARITEAFATADALVVELDDRELGRAGPLFKEAGKLPMGVNMRAVVGNGIYNDVMRLSKQLDLPPNAFENARPWFAGMSLTVVSLTKAGFNPSSGVERLLIDESLATRKPILGIETAAMQANLFASLSPKQEKALLVDALRQSQNVKVQMDTLQTAWLNGDLAELDKLLNGTVMDQAGLGDHLLYARNQNWAQKVALLLGKPGHFFMAVGTAHMVGDKSVVAALEQNGLAVARIQ